MLDKLTREKYADFTQSSHVPETSLINKQILCGFLFKSYLKPEGFEDRNGSNRFFMVIQASKTAMPFKSDPALAAVGDVFGTLSVAVSAIWILL